jgi:hypothetical protein
VPDLVKVNWSRRVFGRHVHSSNLKIINDNDRGIINSYIIFTMSFGRYYETSICSGWAVRSSYTFPSTLKLLISNEERLKTDIQDDIHWRIRLFGSNT